MRDMLSTCKKKILRPFQNDAISGLRNSFRFGNKRVVIQMPTGAGKTITAANIVEGAISKGNRVIFTAPAISLIDQTVSAFEAEGISDIGVIQASHPRTNPDAQVQVCSVQTLARRDIPQAALVIVDECHIRSVAIEKIMDERPDCFFVGLSATPWAKGMGLRWQDLVIPITLQELIDQGYLSKFTAYAPSIPDLTKVKTRAGEYVEADLETVMAEGALVAGVVETWLEKATGRPTLAFGVNCGHTHTIHEAFRSAGVCAAYVDAYTDVVERQLIERQFRSGEVQVVCSVRTMTTGVDWPVSCIVDAAPTKSEILHCLDSKTEILTSEGWKGIGEIGIGDCVASCHGTDQSNGQWAMVTGTVERKMDPLEKWVEYSSVHSNFRVTNNHRMIFGTGKRPFRYGTALEMASKSDGIKFPTAVSIKQTGVPLNSDELYFIGMMMSDGTWGRSQGSISQSERHPEIIRKIEGVLKRLGIGYRKTPVGPSKAGEITERHKRWRYNMSIGMPKSKIGVGRFAPHPKSVRVDGHRGFRHLLPYMDKDLSLMMMALSKEQFLELFNGIWDGDGFKKKGVNYTPSTKQIVTVRPLLADRLQALAAINGITCNLRHFDPNGRARQYHLSFKDRDWRHAGGTGRAIAFNITPATEEKVWCVETTTGNIVTRRAGKVAVMGNCQKIGRGLRVNKGTEDLMILDHAGNSLRLGLVTDILHNTLDATKKGEKKKQKKNERLPKECANCGGLHTGLTCPFCGNERKPVAGVETVDGTLVALTPRKKKVFTKEEKQMWWSGLLHIAANRGRARGWAAHTYRDKIGVWPRGLDDIPAVPGPEVFNYVKAKDIRYAKRKNK